MVNMRVKILSTTSDRVTVGREYSVIFTCGDIYSIVADDNQEFMFIADEEMSIEKVVK